MHSLGPDLIIEWSVIYNAAWDTTPQSYVDAGIVPWGRSRRLARCSVPHHAFKAYLGIHHAGELAANGGARFFLSLFRYGRTTSLRTFASMPSALEALAVVYAGLEESASS